MADDMSRVELGFDSGLIVITKLDAAEWAKLEAALDAGKGIVQIAAPDDTDLPHRRLEGGLREARSPRGPRRLLML